MKKQRMQKQGFWPFLIQSRIPCTLTANAPVTTLERSRRGRLKRVSHRYEGLVGWVRILGWFIPYEWSESEGRWHRFVVNPFGLSPAPHRTPLQTLPITFSSEHTASSPRHPGESET